MTNIHYDCPAGPLPAYLAAESGDGPWPGVVVVHDALGMTADLRRITDRFASNGYLALAPALFRRGQKLRCVVSTVRSQLRGQGPAVDDLIAARDHLAADDRCTGKVGVVGFCMGGGFCLQLAPRGVFDAAAPNYGQLPKDVEVLRRSCPVVASYGVKEYPDVGHSFMNDFPTPSVFQFVERITGLAYSEPEAEDAWRRILVFFGEHLR
jgi:carboxymethylenebutenolidase